MLSKLENLLLRWKYPYEHKRPKNLTLFIFREMERIYQCLKNGHKVDMLQVYKIKKGEIKHE